MAFSNIAGRAAFILDLDKSALDTGLPAAERQVSSSTSRMAKSADDVGASASRAGTALGSGAGLAGRMGLVGVAAASGIQALQHLSAGLRVTGAEAGSTEGRFRNLGAQLAQGDIVGGIVALTKSSYATTQQLSEMASMAGDAAGRLRLMEASAAAASIGAKELATQIDAVVAASLKIDKTTFKFDTTAEFGANPAAVSGQQTFGVTPLAGARSAGADLRNKNAAERRAELDRNAPSTIVNRINTASLTGGLTDDLAAAAAEEAYFANRLRGVKTGSARYTTILASLKQAHSARQSIVDQIASAEKAAADAAKSARDRAAAERKRAADEAARAAAAEARAAEAARAEEARRLRAGLTLRESTLRNNLAEAELTEKNLEDDKKALRRLINFDRQQERNRKLTQIERQQYRTKELQDRKALAALNDTKPDAGKAAADFNKLSFEFLQTQQGFMSQLAANFFDASSKPDVQGRVQTHLTRQVVEHLSSLTARQRNPEGHYGRAEAETAMQVSG